MGTNNIPSRNNWDILFGKKVILKDKNKLVNSYISYMFNRTYKMFEYGNLPDTIPARELELLLQCNRFAIFTKVDDKFYVFYGGLGGIPDMYYLPTIAIVNNPYLKYSKSLDIEKPTLENDGDAVVIWNDTAHIGLLPLNERYAYLLAETDISLRMCAVNTRLLALIQADNDTALDSAEQVLKDIEEGEKIGVIASDGLFDGIKTAEYGNKTTSNIKDLIELKQYLLASWYNELGLQSNFNMKRESLNTNEVGLNEDILLPLVDDMLECRQKAIDEINKKFSLNITVKLSSAWKKERKDIKIEQNMIETKVDTPNSEEEGEEENVTD